MKTLDEQLKAARIKVNSLQFGTQEWEDAMITVRSLVEQIDSAKPKEEYFSCDSGIHRIKLSDGRIIKPGN